MNEPTPEIYGLALEAAAVSQVPPWLVLGTWDLESGFDPQARGDYVDEVPTSFGLGQLNVRGAGAGYTVEELLEPRRNALLSAGYLADGVRAFGEDWKRVASAYNQSVGGVHLRGWDYNARYVALALESYWRWQQRLQQEEVLRYLDAAWGKTRSVWVRDHLVLIKWAVGL